MLIHDITPAVDQLDRTIAKAHYQLIGYKDWRSKRIEVQDTTIIDRNTGCHWLGNKLNHTDRCSCDYDYDQLKDRGLL